MENRDFIKDIPERLKAIRRALNLNQTEFIKKTGIEQGFYSKVENGKLTPSFDFIVRIAEVYNISLDYLILGEGAMFLKDKETNDKIKEQYYALIEKISKMNLENQIKIVRAIDATLDLIPEENPKKD